nr:retrovirus-related Pol polyprotein from transposon TNT 1-94 [Tanacetum cinerariifolium]
MKQAAILREIVEQAKSLNSLDSASYSACKYVKLIQELLGYVRDTCHEIHRPSEKLVAVTPINKKKTVRSQSTDNTKNDRILQISSSTQMKNKVEDQFRIVKSCLNKPNCVVEPSRNANVKYSKLNTNSKLMYVKCNSSMFDARHELCFLELVSNMNASSKSKSTKKAKKKEEWKPTGKVFTKIRYMWRPTGRTFTLVRNACPLTRITATNKVPLREPISLEVIAQESIVTKVYTRRPKVKFLALKDEAPDFIIKFMKMIQVRLNTHVRNIHTYNRTSSGFGLQSMTPTTSSSGLVLNPILQQPFPVADAPRAVDLADSPVSKSIDQDAPSTSAVDPTLFTWKAGNNLLLVQIYVVDIIFASTNTAMCNEFANLMITKFRMSMMEKMSFFLGLLISQSPRGIFLNQSKYAYEIIKKYGLLTSDSVDTPMMEKNKINEDLQGTPVDATLYRGMIGSLMYLTSSRPDLIYAVCLCARGILNICLRILGQEFDEPPTEVEALSFIRELVQMGGIKYITDVIIDYLHQPWRNFASINNKYLCGKEDLAYQIDNKDSKKQDKMFNPRFTKIIIHHFLKKDKSISMRNKMFMHTARDDSLLGTKRFISRHEVAQIYGYILPKAMTNQAMLDSETPSKKKPTKAKNDVTSMKKPAPKPKPSKKKGPVAADRGECDDDERNDDNSNEVTKDDDEDDVESDANDDNEASNSEKTDSDKDENLNLNLNDDEEEEKEEEDVRTPNSFEFNDDDDEEYDELYKDVNVRSKVTGHEKVGKGDAEMTNTTHESTSQEKSYKQVIEDAHVTLTSSHKTEGSKQSSSVSSDFASKFLNLDNVSSVINEVASMMNVKISHEDLSTQAHPNLLVHVMVIPEASAAYSYTTKFKKKSQAEKEKYIDIIEKSMKEIIKDEVKSQLPHILPKEISNFATLVIQSTINESLENDVLAKSSSQPQSTYEAATFLIKFELKKILLDKLEKNKEKDEDPPIGSDQMLKKRKASKDVEPSRGSKSKESKSSSCRGSKSQSKSSSKSAQAEEPVFETTDIEMAQDQGDDLGNIKDQPNVEEDSKHDWFKKLERPLTLDRDWNAGKKLFLELLGLR